MITNVEQAIRDYLPQVIHMSLATCQGIMPWVCEVHYVYDDDLNLYFRSKTSRRHSREIEKNDRVAGNIVKQHSVEQRPRGVYFEGKAQLLTDVDEHHIAYKQYCERFKTDRTILEDAQSEEGHKFYKIAVSTFYVFDGIESSPSQKYELAWNRDQ